MELRDLDTIEREHLAVVVRAVDLTPDETNELLARNGAQAIRVARQYKRERDGAINAAVDAARERDELREQVQSLQQMSGRSMLARLLLPSNAA